MLEQGMKAVGEDIVTMALACLLSSLHSSGVTGQTKDDITDKFSKYFQAELKGYLTTDAQDDEQRPSD